jgi:hypothetical protein
LREVLESGFSAPSRTSPIADFEYEHGFQQWNSPEALPPIDEEDVIVVALIGGNTSD